MKKIYVITLATTEEKAINKYYHLINKHTEDKLSTMDFIDFDYPTLKVIDEEENVEWLINYLTENGFEVSVDMSIQKTDAAVLSIEEYNNLLDKASDGKVGIQNESGEWFYTVTEDTDDSDEAINNMVGMVLGLTVTDVVVDITKQKVMILF